MKKYIVILILILCVAGCQQTPCRNIETAADAVTTTVVSNVLLRDTGVISDREFGVILRVQRIAARTVERRADVEECGIQDALDEMNGAIADAEGE